jgi:hypothetical protein
MWSPAKRGAEPSWLLYVVNMSAARISLATPALVLRCDSERLPFTKYNH